MNTGVDTSIEQTGPDADEAVPAVVYILALGTFLMLTTEMVIAGLLPQIADDLQISEAHTGLMITVFAVGMVVGAPVMAFLTRGVARRTTLVAALAVFVVGHIVIALTTQFTVILVARFVTAIATGAFWAVASVVATDAAAPAARTRALGIVGAGGMLATVLGVPIGTLAGSLVGWHGVFWGLAGLATVAAIVVGSQVSSARPPRDPTSLVAELHQLRSPMLWLTLAACAFTTGGVMTTFTYISPFLTDESGVAERLVPVVLATYGIGALSGSILGGRFGDSRPRQLMVVVPLTTTAILAALYLTAGSAWTAAVLVTLLGLFGLSANPSLIEHAVRFARRAPALGSGLAVAAFNLGTAGGTWLGRASLDTSLGRTGPALVGAVVMAFTIIPVLTLQHLQRRETTSLPVELDRSAHDAAGLDPRRTP